MKRIMIVRMGHSISKRSRIPVLMMLLGAMFPCVVAGAITGPGARAQAPDEKGNLLLAQVVQPPRMTVSPAQIDVDGQAGWVSFTVTNSGGSTLTWSVSEACSWVTPLSPTGGTLGAKESASFSVLYTENPAAASRQCTIRVDAPTAAGGPKNVLLTQAVLGTATLGVTPSERTLGPAEGAFTFEVSNTGSGSLTWVLETPCAWVTNIFPNGGSLTRGQSAAVTVNYGKNEDAAPRSCTFTVSAPGAEGSPKTLLLTQSGSVGNPALSVSPDSRKASAAGGNVVFTVANSGTAAMAWSAAASCDWTTGITPSEGSLEAGQSTTISVSCEANTAVSARNCVVQVTAPGAGGSPKSVAITQDGVGTPALQATPAELNTSAAAGFATFSVLNSGGSALVWSASTTCLWVGDLAPLGGRLDPGQGINVVVHFDSNEEGPARSCTINVEAPGANGSPASVTVTQSGSETPELTVTPAVLNADKEVGTKTFTVSNSGFGTLTWSVESSCDWATQVEPASGALAAGEDAVLTVTYLANEGEDERTCTLTVLAPDARVTAATVTLKQKGTATEEPACGCPLEDFTGDWSDFLKKYLGDLLLLSASIVLVLGLNRFRRD